MNAPCTSAPSTTPETFTCDGRVYTLPELSLNPVPPFVARLALEDPAAALRVLQARALREVAREERLAAFPPVRQEAPEGVSLEAWASEQQRRQRLRAARAQAWAEQVEIRFLRACARAAERTPEGQRHAARLFSAAVCPAARAREANLALAVLRARPLQTVETVAGLYTLGDTALGNAGKLAGLDLFAMLSWGRGLRVRDPHHPFPRLIPVPEMPA